MDPVTGAALISAGTNVLGGLMGSSAQREANQANADEAQKNREFQERMSSTAHQREMKDLYAAGLNPILAANSGASSPSGNTANMQAVTSMADSVKSLGSSAVQKVAMQKDFEAKDAQIALTQQQIATEATKQELNKSSAYKTEVDAVNTAAATNALELKMVGDEEERGSKRKYNTYDIDAQRKILDLKQAVLNATDLQSTIRAKQNLNLYYQKASAEAAGYETDVQQSELDRMNIGTDKKYQGTDQFMKRMEQGVGIGASAASIANPAANLLRTMSNQSNRDYYRVHKHTGEIK